MSARDELHEVEAELRAVVREAKTGNWTEDGRHYVEKYWPYDRMLPSDEPVYVRKAFYLFGSLAMMSFVMLIATGAILVFKGPLWTHSSEAGGFFAALHYWSVQLFFFSIFVHFGSSFFTAAWRGGRGFTWLFGTMTFFTAVLTGLTGYLLSSSFEAQWIGQQGKDSFNSFGFGWLLNVMSMDQIFGWHVVLLPLGVTAFLVLHLLWVRRHGVVPPFPPEGFSFEGAPERDGPTAAEASSKPIGQDAPTEGGRP